MRKINKEDSLEAWLEEEEKNSPGFISEVRRSYEEWKQKKQKERDGGEQA